MSIRVGIYDFFSHLIPGGIFVGAFIYVAIRYQLLLIDLTKVPTSLWLIFGVIAYLAGFVVDEIVDWGWRRLFYPKDYYDKTMIDFNKRNKNIEVAHKEMDWFVILAYIKRQNSEMAQDIEQINATSLMLRNSSFGVFLFGVIFFVEFWISKFSYIFIVASLLAVIASIALGRKGAEFRSWFYRSIYQVQASLMVEIDQMPIKFKNKKPEVSRKNKQ